MKMLPSWSVLAPGALLTLALVQLHAQAPSTESLETAFVAGGRIAITLSAGEHRISASPDDHIRIRWSVGGKARPGEVDARSEVDGSQARVHIDGPRNNFRTVIEVPRRSDLQVRLTAGDLSIEDVVGDKDIRLRAGDLSIDVGDVADYGHVEGSLWAGDIEAGPFNVRSGGLFRSIEWRGDGEHELRFHLYAGDVRLYQE